MQDLMRRKFQLCTLALFTLILAGCGGGGSPESMGSPTDGAQEVLQSPAGLVGPQFPRETTDASAGLMFKPWQYGNGFASGLGSNLVTSNRVTASFNPLEAEPAGSLANMAWCVYRLRCFQQSTSTELQFEWQGEPPAAGICWIGISNRYTESWSWIRLPESNKLMMNASGFANAEHQSYVAIVVSGDTPYELKRIAIVADPDGTTPYTLFNPNGSLNTYLLDMDGNVAHSWASEFAIDMSVYLLDDNTLLRSCDAEATGGRVELLDWDSNVLWSFEDFPDNFYPHHDIEPLPNGNILAIGWVYMTRAEAIAAGRDPALIMGEVVMVDSLVEIKPLEPEGGEIVWRWSFIDHLIQEFDSEQGNFGVVAEHPELLDFNFARGAKADWLHANSVDYNFELDQIVISTRAIDEAFVIDHSTTTAEAATNTGGNSGMGGNILYRWGNPRSYQAGTIDDQQYFDQHDANWIPEGYPGSGNLMIFNNGKRRPGLPKYSEILEITPPISQQGMYDPPAPEFAPISPVWSYQADPPESMFSGAISGARRLPDGNTLICVGQSGYFVEVQPDGQIVWEYVIDVPGEPQSIFRAERYYLFELGNL